MPTYNEYIATTCFCGEKIDDLKAPTPELASSGTRIFLPKASYKIDHQSLLPLVTGYRKDFYSQLIGKFSFQKHFFLSFYFYRLV